MNEADLIHQSRHGDADAWEALTRAHQEPVFRLAYLLLGDPDDAEDIAQETFVRAYYALKDFDTTRSLRPWLLRIASNLARNRRRSIGRYFAALMRAGHKTVQDEPPIVQDDSRSLWQAVWQLKPDSQRVIYLRYFLDMSEPEMAATLNVPAGTIKSRLHRALFALRIVIVREYPHLKETFDI